MFAVFSRVETLSVRSGAGEEARRGRVGRESVGAQHVGTGMGLVNRKCNGKAKLKGGLRLWLCESRAPRVEVDEVLESRVRSRYPERSKARG